jgi:RNA recognition motif-containing protein
MNIFISNLSWAIKDADLRELFAEYGEISSAKVIMDRETGKSRGFGFVEMPNEEEGKKAAEADSVVETVVADLVAETAVADSAAEIAAVVLTEEAREATKS